jgi:hypothetical protein
MLNEVMLILFLVGVVFACGAMILVFLELMLIVSQPVLKIIDNLFKKYLK